MRYFDSPKGITSLPVPLEDTAQHAPPETVQSSVSGALRSNL
jgi:hypothetical protein